MKIKYVNKNFRKSTLDLINLSNDIIDDYQARGYELTLRQLYYQLVARDLFPDNRRYSLVAGKWHKDLVNGSKNAEPNYIWLGTTIGNAREAGLVDWYAIVDRTRARNRRQSWENPSEIIDTVANQYRVDKWKGQEYRLFVWVEKEALAGVIRTACTPHDIQVDFLSCRGYMSQSTIWREAQNLANVYDNGQIPVILHLGDHDPSGIDMTRDNIRRLSLFSDLYEGTHFHFMRIALNYNQVEEHNPPPDFAKLADTRAKDYIAKYGMHSWELDALDPDILVELIQDRIKDYQDMDLWQERVEIEGKDRMALREVADNWEKK